MNSSPGPRSSCRTSTIGRPVYCVRGASSARAGPRQAIRKTPSTSRLRPADIRTFKAESPPDATLTPARLIRRAQSSNGHDRDCHACVWPLPAGRVAGDGHSLRAARRRSSSLPAPQPRRPQPSARPAARSRPMRAIAASRFRAARRTRRRCRDSSPWPHSARPPTGRSCGRARRSSACTTWPRRSSRRALVVWGGFVLNRRWSFA